MRTHVEFKNLGLDFVMNRRLIEFDAFGGGIYYYALIICLGFLLAWLFVNREEKKLTKSEDLSNMLLIGIPAAVVSARAYYVIFSFSDYKDNLWDVFKIWNGGLAIYGGVIGAVLTVVIYCRVKKLSVLHYLDLAAMGFLIGQSVGRWGNFVNGEAHGALCSDTYLLGMHINSQGPFHPTFLYESVLNIIGFFIIYFISKKISGNGFRANCYLIWYGAVRTFVEGLRTDSLYLFGTGIRVSQALSVLMLVSGIVLMTAAFCKKIYKKE